MPPLFPPVQMWRMCREPRPQMRKGKGIGGTFQSRIGVDETGKSRLSFSRFRSDRQSILIGSSKPITLSTRVVHQSCWRAYQPTRKPDLREVEGMSCLSSIKFNKKEWPTRPIYSGRVINFVGATLAVAQN